MITLQEYKEKLLQKLRVQKEEVFKTEILLKALNEELSENAEKQLINASNKKELITSKNTLKSRIYNILYEANKPLTSAELKKENEKIIGKKSADSFSGQLSHLCKRPNSKVKIIEIPDAPITQKYFYTLTEWYIDNELKTEYWDKIKKRRGFETALFK